MDIMFPVISMHTRIPPAAALLAVLALSPAIPGAAARLSHSAAISGHVLACDDGVIPGAKISAAGQPAGLVFVAVTDTRGRFRLPELPAGSYQLEAAAPGYGTWKRAGIDVAAGKEVALTITLQLDDTDEEATTRDLPTWWRSVDAVVYVRVTESMGSRPVRTGGQCAIVGTQHRASVFEVFRRYRGEPREQTLEILQRSAGVWQDLEGTLAGRRTPCQPGQELIVFLTWNNLERTFQDALIVPVKDGQVRSAAIEELQKGMNLEDFLKMLRAMME